MQSYSAHLSPGSSQELRPEEGFGVYVHFPWCLKKCPYCDFLSVAVPREAGDSGTGPLSAEQARNRLPHRAYADAVIAELHARAEQVPLPRGGLRSVFFGGGTPSLWEPEELGRVLEEILRVYGSSQGEHVPEPTRAEQARAGLPQRPIVEVTAECNPTSLDETHANRLADAGVNRLSVGVQGLDNKRLEFLGRLHSDEGGLFAVKQALASRIARVSADLIFGVHRQDPDAAVAEALRVAKTGVSHLSAYALTIEPATRFGALHKQGGLPLLDEALVALSFTRVSEALRDEGFSHYEISNFCLEGQESVHNLGYWLGRDYLGLGTGAFGTVSLKSGRLRYRNLLSPERYQTAFLNRSKAHDPFQEDLTEKEDIPPDVAIQEALLLGLRTERGVDLGAISALRGGEVWNDERTKEAARLESAGKLLRKGDHLSIPREHWLFADGIIRDLL